jgi:hypothetical protein
MYPTPSSITIVVPNVVGQLDRVEPDLAQLAVVELVHRDNALVLHREALEKLAPSLAQLYATSHE